MNGGKREKETCNEPLSKGTMPVKTDSEFKQFFWDLASEDKEKRVKAGCALAASLLSKSGAERKEYVDYTTDRLIKGLGSNRECARQGFAVAFCDELVEHDVPIEQVFELVDKNLMVSATHS